MALVARLAFKIPDSERWSANLSSGAYSYRYQGKWIQMTSKNTKISKKEGSSIVWIPAI